MVTIAEVRAKVDSAYSLHDTLFSIADSERTVRMEAGRAAALAAVQECEAAEAATVDGKRATDPRPVQAQLRYLRGKATASTEDGRRSEEAERLLAEAVKLDPSIVDAWNCLGECYWQRGELESARHVFRAALEHRRDASTLCHLSMLLRAMSATAGAGNLDALLLESVSLAKEAVRQETGSSRCWSGLGAAHLSLHVHVSSEAEDLHMANRAFTQAGKTAAHDEPDMLINHATVLQMLDSPEAALQHYQRAYELDPDVKEAISSRDDLWSSIVKISEAIGAGRVTSNRLRSRASPPDASKLPAGISLYPLSGLSLGENAGKAVAVTVVVPVPQSGLRAAAAHQSLIVADTQDNLMALSLYALRGVPPLEAGTALEVREPHLMRVEASKFWERQGAAAAAATGAAAAAGGALPVQQAGYHLMRVDHPTVQLRIDGQAVRPMRPGVGRR